MNRCFETCLSMQIQESMSVNKAAHLLVFFSIFAHLAHLAQSFFVILDRINKSFDTCLSMQIQEHVNELNWLFG